MTRPVGAPRHFMALMTNGAMVMLNGVQNEIGMRRAMKAVGAEIEELDDAAAAAVDETVAEMAANRRRRRP